MPNESQRSGEFLLFFSVLCLLTAISAGYYIAYVSWALLPENGAKLGTDFNVIWNAVAALARDDFAAVYDTHIIDDYLETGIIPQFIGPFPYPPTMLFFLEPLTGLSRHAAYAVWNGAGFAGLLLVLLSPRAREVASGIAHTPAHYAFAVLAVMGSALSVAVLITGQTGFLTGALLLAGLLYRRTSPLLAGIAFGLLTVKPQLGLLVPVLLIAQGNWRTFFAAAATALVLAALSVLVYGAEAWQAYFHMTERFAKLFSDTPPTVYQISASLYLGLKMLGLASGYAMAAQLVAIAACVAFVWKLGRDKTIPEPVCIALFILANYVASPYAMSYDLMALAFALMLLVLRALHAGFMQGERVVLGVALFTPLFVPAFQPHGIPVMAGMLVLLLGYYGVGVKRPQSQIMYRHL